MPVSPPPSRCASGPLWTPFRSSSPRAAARSTWVFIDADKPNTPAYLRWALKLCRRGSLIIIDNVVREGEVIDAAAATRASSGSRRANELLATEPRLSATAIQTVGSKGHDGFAIALVTADE